MSGMEVGLLVAGSGSLQLGAVLRSCQRFVHRSTHQAPRPPQRASRATTSQPGLARSNIKFTGTSNLVPPHSHACSSDHQHTSTQATSICLGDASSCLREPRRLLDRQWSVAVVPQKYRRHHPSSTTGNEREEKKIYTKNRNRAQLTSHVKGHCAQSTTKEEGHDGTSEGASAR